MENKDKPMTQYKLGDLVYLISHQTSLLKFSNRKCKAIYIAPLVVYKIKDKFQYILMEIKGKILNGISHFNRYKEVYIRTTKRSTNSLVDLKQIINLGI